MVNTSPTSQLTPTPHRPGKMGLLHMLEAVLLIPMPLAMGTAHIRAIECLHCTLSCEVFALPLTCVNTDTCDHARAGAATSY